MKAILDPFIFWLPPTDPSAQEIESLLRSMDFVVGLHQEFNYQLAVTKVTWDQIRRDFIAVALKHIPSRDIFPRVKAIERMLTFVAPPQQEEGVTWGVRSLYIFPGQVDPHQWADSVASLLAYWIGQQEEVILAVRLFEGRNVQLHQTGNSRIYEKVNWKVYVAAATVPQQHVVRCIHHKRNLGIPWTGRFDIALPDTCPTPGMAFIPNPAWDAVATVVVRTHSGRPTWVDTSKNFWADPNTPGAAYHWDVFLTAPADIKKFGVNPINITCWGRKDGEKIPGSVHHVPAQKQPAMGGSG